MTFDQQDTITLVISQLEQLITESEALLKVAAKERGDRLRP
jgi:hypothetical protein